MFWYIVLRLAAFLARRVPKRWGLAFSRRLGRAIYRVSPVAERSRDNMRHVLGTEADPDLVSRLARRSFEERTQNYFELLWLSGVPLEEISARTEFMGLEYISELVAEKRGCIAVGGHIGPVEFMIQYLAALGLPLIGVTEHLKSERLHRYVISLRAAHGLDLISTQGSLLDVYRRIKQGGVLASATDRDSTDTGVVVELFGAPAWMADGYARLAVRANVPVIFGHPWRTENGVKAQLFPPLYPDSSLGKEEAVLDLVQRTTRLLENAIRQDPAAWHLSSPVWRLAQERLERGEAT
jgi:lauroyl/myristoyl acyltransferase